MTIDINYINKLIKFNNSNQDYIHQLADSLSNQRSNAISSFQILINSSQAKDIVLNNLPYKAMIDVRILKESIIKTMKMNQGIMKYGDYFQYHNNSTNVDEIYLVKSKVEPTLEDYDSAFVINCNSSLKYKAIVDNVATLIEIPCIAGNGIVNLSDDKYFDLINNTISINIGYSLVDKVKYIKDTGVVTRFILGSKAYKVKGVDNITNVFDDGVTKSGMITIKLESNEIMAEDDLINNVAYNILDNIVVPPPVTIPVSTYQIVTSTTPASDYNYIINGSLRTQKVYNTDLTPITDGSIVFTFSLEVSVKNPTIGTSQLITLMDNVTATTVRLTASSTVKGYVILVGTSGSNVVKREIRIKGQYDV